MTATIDPRDVTRDCEKHPAGHEHRVSTIHVPLPDGTFNRAACAGADISMALARAALEQGAPR